MAEKESFKFRVVPLSANNFFSWSNDMGVILLEKGLWKYMEADFEKQNQNRLREASSLDIDNMHSRAKDNCDEIDAQKQVSSIDLYFDILRE